MADATSFSDSCPLSADEMAVLRWFIQNGAEVSDGTIERLCADTQLPKARVFECIFALAEDGLLKISAAGSA